MVEDLRSTRGIGRFGEVERWGGGIGFGGRHSESDGNVPPNLTSALINGQGVMVDGLKCTDDWITLITDPE